MAELRKHLNAEAEFRRGLKNHLAAPLILAFILAASFVAMLVYVLSATRWVDHTDRVISQSRLVFRLLVDAETGMRGYLVTGDRQFLEPLEKSLSEYPSQLQALKKLNSDSPSQLKRIDQIESKIQEWVKWADATNKMWGKTDFRSTPALRTGKALMDSLRADFFEFVGHEESLRDARVAHTDDVVRLFLTLVIAVSAGAGLLLAFVGRKQLYRISHTYNLVLEREAKQNAALREQDWVKTGLTRLSAAVRGGPSLPQLSERVLNCLMDYLKAEIGAFYVLTEGGQLLRTAVCAGNETASQEPIDVKASLVGHALQSQKVVSVSAIPEDCLPISTGLVTMRPRKLWIAPAGIDGENCGAVELGFLDFDEKLAIRTEKFLSLASEILGFAVRTAQNKTRLEQLLRTTQNQAEELQTQQEELRVSNEELESQTHVLREAQNRLEHQQTELELSNQQLEEQARLLEQQKDDLDRRNEELESSQRALTAKASELERSNKYKSEFLANMSHELRTPLNSSLIIAKLLMENSTGNLTAEQVEFAQTIYSAGNDLLNLINDILDLAKVESGHLDVRPESIEIQDLLTSLKRGFLPVAKDKGLRFLSEISPNMPEFVFSDRLRLEQIIKNLISNALKFTESGYVKLTFNADAEDPEHFSIEVEDTGIGIPKESQAIIFEAFRQADGSTNRKYGGTGLGLSISRELSRLLGGHLILKSEVGKGSVFSVVLPVKYSHVKANTERTSSRLSIKAVPVASETKTAASPPSAKTAPRFGKRPESTLTFADDRNNIGPKDRTILVIEDDIPFAKILFELAHEMNFKCVVATNAASGLNTAKGLRPHAIFLDVRLPDESGLSLMDWLKTDPLTRHIPVHFVSGGDYAQVALQMGAVGYSKKPVPIDSLRKAFQSFEARASHRMRKVLVVEDDANLRNSTMKLLQSDNVEVVAVETGETAKEKLKMASFDCVVMDLSLPDMSGYDLLEQMAEESKGTFPPVIIYTGRDLSRDEELRLRKYSQSVVVKGAKSPERLLEEATLFLHQIESRLPEDRQMMLRNLRHRERTFESKTILIVDDDVRNIFALTHAVEQKGARVEVARNGREAVEKLNGSSPIDLVLMDIMMPEMDGFEAMKLIRKNPRHEKLPIIAVTAKAMADDQEQCLKAGANDYLTKPIDIEKLLSLIRVWLPRIQRG